MSWGRTCAAVALVVAVVGQIKGMDIEHLKLWLGVAVGNYGASKITEMVCGRVDVGVAAPPATEARASASDSASGSAKNGGEA